jgi:cell division transport system ATP-binding protein
MASETIIELTNVQVFIKKHLVLSNVSIQINKGEFVFLVGKNGSGKSSFLKTLYGELTLEHGEGNVAGFNLKELKRKKVPFLRREIGIVFQDFQLLTDRSVNENLKFVMKATGWKEKRKMEEAIQELLTKVGLGTKGFKFPHELSGGEQQRVAIARALVNDPDIILADEPTGNLDPETSNEIMKLLFSIAQNGKAVLMATHDYELMAKFPGRTLSFEKGTIDPGFAKSSNQAIIEEKNSSESID